MPLRRCEWGRLKRKCNRVLRADAMNQPRCNSIPCEPHDAPHVVASLSCVSVVSDEHPPVYDEQKRAVYWALCCDVREESAAWLVTRELAERAISSHHPIAPPNALRRRAP